MNIAIVGGGFFGCYIARALERELPGHSRIDIFESSPALMSGAATNNQARVHLGFHYPRSAETIRQTVLGFGSFVSEFSECVSFPADNLYAIHRGGHISFDEYLAALSQFDLDYEICGSVDRKYFVNPEEIEGVIRVGEGAIDLAKLRQSIVSRLQVHAFCNAHVTGIDTENRVATVNGEQVGPYDFIVNASYTNPNLGLTEDKRFALKYELACMALIRHPFDESVGLTVMDGNFASLYPWPGGLATLSSVPFTPFRCFATLEEMNRHLLNADCKAEKQNAVKAVMNHGRELFQMRLDGESLVDILVAPKCKLLHDNGATRESHVRFHGRFATVLAGKLDACHAVAEVIVQHIRQLDSLEAPASVQKTFASFGS